MDSDNRKSRTLVGTAKEVGDASEESMEYWFNRGVSDVEEGEVVRGRVVEVRDSDNLQTGSYAIGYETLTPISRGFHSLHRGGIVSGTIGKNIEKDQWTFTGRLGDRVELITTSTAKQAGFSAFVDVYAPSGTLVDSFFSGSNRQLDLT